ncbi:MAG TPA: DNA cytosine methyltransferase [Acidimicrobiales bacterium]|nr:DNA cytosine methyltransferase [Acidimicrobiales bacterium]
MKILDLFCCEGGAGVGYDRAGFEVFGVDMDANRLKRYPFESWHGDVLELLTFYTHLDQFDAIHASPPCQGYTRGNAGRVTKWPKLIPAVREALQATGLPYVIENVTDAGPEMVDPVALCGCMFDLSTVDTDGIRIHLKRERLFETNFPLSAPRPCDHSGIEWFAGAYGGARRDKYEAKYVRKGGYVPKDKRVVKNLLGIKHDMTWNGLFECIPPAFSEHIGTQLLAHLNAQESAA